MAPTEEAPAGWAPAGTHLASHPLPLWEPGRLRLLCRCNVLDKAQGWRYRQDVQPARLAAAGPGPAQQAGPAPTAVRSRWWRSFPITPLRVVAAYAVVGLLWIGFSDQALRMLIPDPALRDELQTLKGAFFVLATAALIFELVRRGQRALVRFGAEIRAAVESMVDGVLVADASGLVEANRAAVELLGAGGKDQLLGSLEQFVERFQLRRTDGVPIPVSELATARALRGERTTAEAVLRRGDGKDVVVSLASAPIVYLGSPGLAITVLRDVSSAHRLEAMRDEFLATAAHELKTPLAVVKAYAQLVQRRTPAESPALAVVQRQVDRMTRLVQHLLDASRLRLDTGSRPRRRSTWPRVAAEVVGAGTASRPGPRPLARDPVPGAGPGRPGSRGPGGAEPGGQRGPVLAAGRPGRDPRETGGEARRWSRSPTTGSASRWSGRRGSSSATTVPTRAPPRTTAAWGCRWT